MSKVIEQLIIIRRYNFLKANNVIWEQQYGFQKGKSTELALLNIKDKIIDNMEQKLYTKGFFIDLKKMFYSIKHHILLQKRCYGIRGITLLKHSVYTKLWEYGVHS